MDIKSLRLRNFRNYSDEYFEFSPQTNLIYGDNAQGKTNILEAVNMASTGRSYRAKQDTQTIKFGEDFSQIILIYRDKNREYKICVNILSNGKKSITINNVPINKLSVLVNYLNVVVFSPEDLDLVKGTPQSRRRFIDTALSSVSPRYLSELVTYYKALSQKNSLLRELKYGSKKALDTLDIWNMQLASSGAKLMNARAEFIKDIAKFAKQIHAEITENSLEIEYVPSIDTAFDETSIYNRFCEVASREVENGSSLYGIQRDDIKFFIDNSESKAYASQGQQRTIVLCLKLAVCEYIKQKREEYPVLLLDDIMSELDQKHRTYLAEKIKGKQVLLTCTDKEGSAAKFFKIENGKQIKE